MPVPLVTQHHPDDFKTFSYNIHSQLTSGNLIVFYADRDLVIDSITVGVAVVQAGGSIAFVRTTGGTLASPKSAAPASLTTDAVAITGSQSVATLGTFTPTIIFAADANLVKAGNYVGITIDTVAAFRGYLQIRVRSRIG